jgi:hypothetical protein
MAKITTVDFSNVDGKCMAAERFLDKCHECKRVARCDLPESQLGRLRSMVKTSEEVVAKMRTVLEALEEELGKGQ